jgi:hypothetical protein
MIYWSGVRSEPCARGSDRPMPIVFDRLRSVLDQPKPKANPDLARNHGYGGPRDRRHEKRGFGLS